MKSNKKLPLLRSMVACFATLGLVSIAVANNQSSAQPSNKQEIEARFNAADTNGDGQITLAEAQAGMPRVAMAWDKIDVDKKGYITLDQLLAIVAANQ